MNKVYENELHYFIEAYFHQIGAKIVELQNDYFTVALNDKVQKAYTYSPRIAAENNEITLLAKGSRELKKIMAEVLEKSLGSQVNVSHSHESIKNGVTHKQCCEMCPFINVCTKVNTCCDMCPNFKLCNSYINNAEFSSMDVLGEKEQIILICFIFNVELSNDYTLSQKTQKNILIPINLNDGTLADPVFLRDLEFLDIKDATSQEHISADDYDSFLSKSKFHLENTMQEHLEVFKKEIQDPLQLKISSILNKFGEEYTDNYSRLRLEELEKLENEATRLTSREINGYGLNITYTLMNAVIIHSSKDTLKLGFKNINSDKMYSATGEAYMGRISMHCTQCSLEIDQGTFCEDNHLLCSKCTTVCSHCSKVICELCDDEDYVCSTCGEIICSDCKVECEGCGSVNCKLHSYNCQGCQKSYCIDCHELCKTCDEVICQIHSKTCNECGHFSCSKHTHHCSECTLEFCSEHINNCDVCSTVICDEHTYVSAFSGKSICLEHKSICTVCEDIFCVDEMKKCSKCGDLLCPTHVKECHSCQSALCLMHSFECPICSKAYCDCTKIVTCTLCDTECCEHCIDSKGRCILCNGLEEVTDKETTFDTIYAYDHDIRKPHKIFMSTNGLLTNVYFSYFNGGIVYSLDMSNNVLKAKKVGFIGNVKNIAKFLTRKR